MCAQSEPRARSLRLLPLLEVLLDHIEHAQPPRPLTLDPFLGVGESLGTEPEPVVAPVDHARDDSSLLEHARWREIVGFDTAKPWVTSPTVAGPRLSLS